MITLNLTTAIAGFFSVLLLIVVCLTVGYTYKRSKEGFGVQKSEDLQQCPYCGHVFFEYQQKEIGVCPQCKSYIAIEGKKDEEADE